MTSARRVFFHAPSPDAAGSIAADIAGMSSALAASGFETSVSGDGPAPRLDEDALLVYQYAGGELSRVSRAVARIRGRVVIRRHGAEEPLADRGAMVWLDGGRGPRVLPPFLDARTAPDAAMLARLAARGGVKLLCDAPGDEMLAAIAGAVRRHVAPEVTVMGIGDGLTPAELRACYLACDVFFWTGRGGPIAPLVEALRSRLPVVARHSLAAADVVGDSGFVWRGTSPYPYVESIALCLDDAPTRAALARAGARRYERLYSPAVLSARLLELVNEAFAE